MMNVTPGKSGKPYKTGSFSLTIWLRGCHIVRLDVRSSLVQRSNKRTVIIIDDGAKLSNTIDSDLFSHATLVIILLAFRTLLTALPRDPKTPHNIIWKELVAKIIVEAWKFHHYFVGRIVHSEVIVWMIREDQRRNRTHAYFAVVDMSSSKCM